MAIVVIGGQTRNIGKTSAVCALIAAMPERRWTAIKITQCKHSGANGEPCDCELGGQAAAISEEHDVVGRTDSSRYLAAGAVRSLWVRTLRGRLGEAMERIRAEIDASANVILESNSILAYLKPDLYAVALDPGSADFKVSALEALDRADAVLVPADAPEPSAWQGIPAERIKGIPVFRSQPSGGISPELIAFVARRLNGDAKDHVPE